MKKYILGVIVLIVFAGCVSDSSNISKPKITNFNQLTQQLSEPLCSKIKDNSLLYMTDFVNEKNLQNRSQLGFLLSNELKVNILKPNCTNGVSFKSFQLATNLFSNEKGTHILTRDLKYIKAKTLQEDKKIIVGTYMFTPEQLILFLKYIDLESGNILFTTSTSTAVTDEIKNLEGINTKPEEPYIRMPFHL